MRDAQAPVGATDFDELDAEDSDAEDDGDTVSFNPRRRISGTTEPFPGHDQALAGACLTVY